MDEFTEKEQLEMLRAWWSEYGNYVIGGIVVGVAIIVGLSQYRSQTTATQTEASTTYETVVEAVANGSLEEAEAAATELYEKYASTVYPAQARLAMARLYMDNGRDEDAAKSLQVLVGGGSDSELRLVARMRLAKIYLYQGKAQEVIDLLSNVDEGAFTARYSEAIGDAHVALGQFNDAQEAYLRAIADDPKLPTVDRVLVQMKIDDLPEAVAVVDASASIAPAASSAEVAPPAGEVANDAADSDDTADNGAAAETAADPASDETGTTIGDAQ